MSSDVAENRGIACPQCAHTNPDGWIVCANCRTALPAHDPFEVQNIPEATLPQTRKFRRRTPALALASLAFGVAGIFAPAGILAVIFGHVAFFQIRRNRDRYRGKDVAKLGMLLGYAGLIFFAVFLSGFKYGPTFLRATAQKATLPSAGDEKSDPYYRAIRNRPEMSIADRENKGVTLLKSLQKAEQNYQAAHPNSGYSCNLEDLFEFGFDAGMVQLSVDTGYILSISGCTNTTAPNHSYQAFATPPPGSGNLLCADDQGVIRASNSPSSDTCIAAGKPIAIQ